jgi:hypothetical protein
MPFIRIGFICICSICVSECLGASKKAGLDQQTGRTEAQHVKAGKGLPFFGLKAAGKNAAALPVNLWFTVWARQTFIRRRSAR